MIEQLASPQNPLMWALAFQGMQALNNAILRRRLGGPGRTRFQGFDDPFTMRHDVGHSLSDLGDAAARGRGYLQEGMQETFFDPRMIDLNRHDPRMILTPEDMALLREQRRRRALDEILPWALGGAGGMGLGFGLDAMFSGPEVKPLLGDDLSMVVAE